MRVVAIVAAYNEERFIGGCLEHLVSHGVDVYLIDNSSTDRTAEIAGKYVGRGLIGIETLPRPGGVHRWTEILKRKEELASTLEADWFVHADPDEVRLPPRSNQTLAEALADVDAKGYNAANFLEYTFVPTREAPDHDHPDFVRTMRWYYPFMRNFPYRVNAWKRQPERVNLVHSQGHRTNFSGLCVYPEPFKMKHYQFLSLEHARVKYFENKRYGATEAEGRAWRARLVEERMRLPSRSELHAYASDDELSISNPRTRHMIESWASPEADGRTPKRAVEQENGGSRGTNGELKSDRDRLARWMQELDDGITVLLNSRRWRLSEAASEAVRRARRKPRVPTVEDHLVEVVGMFRNWKEGSDRARDQAEGLRDQKG